MGENELLARRFEEDRAHLRGVAYRMLGSLSEAEDAVQETWIRLSRTDVDGIGNLTGWLTTAVGRICLDMLRSRRSRPEEPFGVRIPDPVLAPAEGGPDDPESEALRADSVGLALLVVLDTLGPAERLAYVLHDLFAVPFDDIAPVVDRTPAATRQLASRARRRIREAAPAPETDPVRHRAVVDAFVTASRNGDFDALLPLLDPDVVLRVDMGALAGGLHVLRGAKEVAGQAFAFRARSPYAMPVLVNGLAGFVTAPGGRPESVMALTVVNGRITEIHILADPERMAALDMPV